MIDITVEEHGRILVGLRSSPFVLPQAALPVIQRYLFSLVNLIAGHNERSLLYLPTQTQCHELIALYHQVGSARGAPHLSGYQGGGNKSMVLSIESKRWVNELLSTREIALWLGQDLGSDDAFESTEREALWERLVTPRTVLEVLWHEDTLVLLGRPEQGTTIGLAVTTACAQALLSPESALNDSTSFPFPWFGPVFVPAVVDATTWMRETSVQSGQQSLFDYIAAMIGDGNGVIREWLLNVALGNRLFVVVTGLDATGEEARIRVFDAVKGFMQSFPGNRILIGMSDVTVDQVDTFVRPLSVAVIEGSSE